MATQFSKDGNWKLEQGSLYESIDGAWLWTFNVRNSKGIGDAISELREYVQSRTEDNATERDIELADRYKW